MSEPNMMPESQAQVDMFIERFNGLSPAARMEVLYTLPSEELFETLRGRLIFMENKFRQIRSELDM
jgi:hypothetical protein